MYSQMALLARLEVQDVGGLGETLARFLETQPLVAGIVAAVVLALGLLLLRKVFNVALVVVAIVAVLGGVLVYLVGPDQAQGYLEELQEQGQRLLEEVER